VYFVRRGDSLSLIAQRNNTTVSDLAQLNNITNPNLIYAGQRLVVASANLPPVPTAIVIPTLPQTATNVPRRYRVAPGDTLLGIASRFRVTIAALLQANRIRNPNLIYIGQVLTIP
jgi:lysozyme